jgi:hypothetical protein
MARRFGQLSACLPYRSVFAAGHLLDSRPACTARLLLQPVEVCSGHGRPSALADRSPLGPIVSRRDREDGSGLVKLGLGFGVGLGLFMLFGGGGGFGFGRGSGPAATGPAPFPPDTKPVEIRVRPSPTDPRTAIIEMEGTTISLPDLIARVNAGGRRDVVVTVSGVTREGAWQDIATALRSAGITIIRHDPVVPSAPAAPTKRTGP